MSNYIANEQDHKTAEQIRRQYLEPEENKLDQLRKLDEQVKKPGMIVALTLGIIGALVMGGGMALIMAYGNMVAGLALSIPGLLILIVAYPLCRTITDKRKKEYAPRIMQLSDSIMND
mgnify:FL=1